MACKQGIRANIEASKAYYAKLREPDPVRDYWIGLVKRVHMQAGLEGLSQSERIYFVVTLFEGEVYNGGVHQFFLNSSGEYYTIVVEGLSELGATRSLDLLQKARKALFPDTDPPTDTAARRQILPWWPEDKTAPPPAWSFEIERIDRELWSDPDRLGEKLKEYATRHRLIPDARVAEPDAAADGGS